MYAAAAMLTLNLIDSQADGVDVTIVHNLSDI